MSEVELYTDELICHRKYLRAIFHLRPKMDLQSAAILLDSQRISLRITHKDDFVLLEADALISGIENAHTARVVLVPRKNGFFSKPHPIVISDLVDRELKWRDPFHALTEKARKSAEGHLQQWDVLEIGSRTRDATRSSWESLRQNSKSYVGMDIVSGPNVDVVGDAHALSKILAGKKFDFIYSQFVFEHLAMPWVAAAEMNKVMKIGGEALVISNQSIGMHDIPWDFYRFSDSAWRTLFNEDTGFDIISTAVGETVRITPLRYHRGFIDHESGAGYQASGVWLRKVADKDLSWGVAPETIFRQLARMYPEQIVD